MNDAWTPLASSVSCAISDVKPRQKKPPGPRIRYPDAICNHCGKPFRPRHPKDPSTGKFCSTPCFAEFRKAATHAFREGLLWKPNKELLAEARAARFEIAAAERERNPRSFPPFRPDWSYPDDELLDVAREVRKHIQAGLRARRNRAA